MTTTYNDLTTQLRLRWVDVEDVRATQHAVIEVTPEAAYLELPRGKKGDKGDKGDPGPGFWFRSLITDKSQLPRDLQDVDRGAAFPDTKSKSLWVWDGAQYFEIPNFIGLRGEPGATPRVQIGKVEPGGQASVSVNQAASTPDTVVLDFVLPQGPRGPEGPEGAEGSASNVSSSPDVDMSREPSPGEALTWNGFKWAPRSVLAPVGPFALGPNDFTAVDVPLIGSGNVSEKLVASLTIPGQPFDWRPLVVSGLVKVETPLGVQYDAEVRVGNAQQGDIVGYGVGRVFQRWDDPTIIRPFFPQSVSPGSTYGVVKANTATTLYVVLRKHAGTIGAWKTDREWSSLVVMAQPVVRGV
ncbi:phage tail protein [Corynebacterium auriscanis]|uniref:phage tail protein n=1 Tax=Corynebacterium auriscanis TaxID=99807 RepID=UPI003CEEBB46